MVCRYCQAKGVTDPKCKCCAGTDMAKAAIAKETKEEKTVLELEDTQPIKIEEIKEELIKPSTPIPMPQPIPIPEPIEEKKEEKTCWVSEVDPKSGELYWVERNKDGSFTDKSQWEKPKQSEQCKRIKKRDVCIEHKDCKNTKKPYCNPVQEKCNKLQKGWYMATNPEGKAYFYGVKKDGTNSEPQWNVPTEPFVEKPVKSLKQKSWDASKTIGSCREMDLHPGTEYWINPADGSMSFEPIDGVEKQTVTEETDYFYNTEGKTTFDPSDGTCGNILTKKNK